VSYAWGERATLYADYGRDTFTFDLDSTVPAGDGQRGGGTIP
jgi:hypothetical protein